MQVILLERVKTRPDGRRSEGEGRLRPQLSAARKESAARHQGEPRIFRPQKAQLEANNLERKKDAEAVAKKLNGKTFVLLRQAGDRGQLYGSVSPRDISDVITTGGFTVARGQVPLDKAIKSIGLVPVAVVLHPEVKVSITLNVARTEEEAERQARGEDVLAEKTDAEEAKIAAEELFEEGAAPKEITEEEAAAGDEVTNN